MSKTQIQYPKGYTAEQKIIYIDGYLAGMAYARKVLLGKGGSE